MEEKDAEISALTTQLNSKLEELQRMKVRFSLITIALLSHFHDLSVLIPQQLLEEQCKRLFGAIAELREENGSLRERLLEMVEANATAVSASNHRYLYEVNHCSTAPPLHRLPNPLKPRNANSRNISSGMPGRKINLWYVATLCISYALTTLLPLSTLVPLSFCFSHLRVERKAARYGRANGYVEAPP